MISRQDYNTKQVIGLGYEKTNARLYGMLARTSYLIFAAACKRVENPIDQTVGSIRSIILLDGYSTLIMPFLSRAMC